MSYGEVRVAGKWYVYLTNEDTRERVYIEASSKEGLNSKVNKQRNEWQKQKYLQELEELKEEANLLIQQYKETLNTYNSIIELGIDYPTYEDYYVEKDLNDNVPTFDFLEKKPEISEIYRKFNVPKENILLEKISKAQHEKRLSLEREAQDYFQKRSNEYEGRLKNELEKYEKQKSKTILENIEFNKIIKEKREKLLNKDQEEVEVLLSRFIKRLIYLPDNEEYPYNNADEVEYIPKNSTLVISRKLPKEENLPEYADVKWDSKNNEIVMIDWKKKDLSLLHEKVIFQIVLKTISHIFEFIPSNVVDRIVFNGWLDYVNPRNGKDQVACVISLDVDREIFMEINLSRVDFKSCIKDLRGIISPNFYNIIPVQPILNLNRNDKRFVNSIDVSDIIQDGQNLATMDWEDFEYLIRQLFSKIFTYSNSEVKITQASRDGGVDAIAFDPDPIRGGKFIIQAKRYNILVPVSAVRDLYGTMLHEGATRGILVTTSDYGQDSYKFAKEKPITLINGRELLGLLHQHEFKNVHITLQK